MNTRWLQLFLAASLAMLAYPAFAVQTLRLVSTGGAVNSQTSASLTIENGSSSSGFNAEIVLPNGVSLVEVAKGDLLTTGQYTLHYVVTNQNLRVIVYSTTDTFGPSGELLKLRLQITPNAPQGMQKLAFASSNTDPLIGSKHALSSPDGLLSMPHNVQDSQFLITNLGIQTIVFGSAPTVIVGSTGSVSTTGGASGNPVTITTSSSTCTLSNIVVNGNSTTATVNGMHFGDCIIAANQSGTANYNPAPQANLTIPILKGGQSINFGLAPILAVGGTGTVSAMGGGSNNPVTLTVQSASTGICSIGNSVVNGATTTATVTGKNVGTCKIDANQAGNNDYNIATPTTQTVSVATGLSLNVINSNKTAGKVISDVGGIACGSTCSANIAAGTLVTLTAIPTLKDFQFTGWGGDCRGYGNTCQIQMDTAKNVTANFGVFKRHRPIWKGLLLRK